MHLPESPEELAATLAELARRARPIVLEGHGSKALMGGPIVDEAETVSTRSMARLLQYEPRDLTVSVEAGMPFRELTRLLAANGQSVPLDPAFAAQATVGGIVAANSSGPRRRLFGTARDQVIGMTFATLEGKLIQTGGMVVKNVAGLDMAKLMIGSFGTLAAIASVNFKVHPIPQYTRTFLQRFASVEHALKARDAVLSSVLQPAAIDLVKRDGEVQLLIAAGGSAAVLERYSRELAGYQEMEGDAEAALWQEVREGTPDFLAAHPQGVVLRVPSKLSVMAEVLAAFPMAIARAASGVCYGYCEQAPGVVESGVVEFAPHDYRRNHVLWPQPDSDFAMMKKIKAMFDPNDLLNRGRLFGRI